MQELILQVKTFADAGQFSQALEDIERVIAMDSACTEAYLIKAQVLQSLMQLPAALNTLQLAASLEPDRPDVYCEIGQLLLSLSRFADAQVVFTRAANLDSGSAAAHEGLGIACLRLGKLELGNVTIARHCNTMPLSPVRTDRLGSCFIPGVTLIVHGSICCKQWLSIRQTSRR